jgi:hypothetical protein
MLAFGTIRNEEEWNQLQTTFLQNHRYFTVSSLKNRQPKQEENLRALQHKTTTLMTKNNAVKISALDTIYTIAGILFCGFALKSFLVPNAFFDGGVTGISLLIHELYHVNIAYVIIIANIPFIIMGLFR